MTAWLLLLCLILGATASGNDAIFSVRHFLNDYDRDHVLVYAGHPPRSTNFAVLFSVPRAADIHMNASGDAQDADLPGQFAALHVKQNDPLAAPYRAQISTADSVMSLPKMKVVSLGMFPSSILYQPNLP